MSIDIEDPLTPSALPAAGDDGVCMLAETRSSFFCLHLVSFASHRKKLRRRGVDVGPVAFWEDPASKPESSSIGAANGATMSEKNSGCEVS